MWKIGDLNWILTVLWDFFSDSEMFYAIWSLSTSLPSWCISPIAPPSPSAPPVWVKNYCIWCNLMDCWTVNILDSQTAVLPRVKCDGWAGGSGGTYGNDRAWKESVIFCAFVSLTSDHTEAFICFSFENHWPMRNVHGCFLLPSDQYTRFPSSKSDCREIHPANVSIRTSAKLIDTVGE